MTASPYPISGIVYSNDGTTVVEGAVVTAWNATKNEQMPGPSQSTTNSSGEYTLDLANFPTDYANNDVIFILATSSNKSIDHRTTVDTGTGSESKDLNLHLNPAETGKGYLVAASVATDTDNEGVRLYDRWNDEVLDIIETQNSRSNSHSYGSGKPVIAGVALIYSDDAGNSTAPSIPPNQGFVVISTRGG